MSHRDPSTNVFKLSLECYNKINDVHLVDSIIDSVTDTPSIFTTIKVLTIHVDCVVMKLPQLSVYSSLTILKLCFISTETTTFNFPSLKHCTSVIFNLSVDRKKSLVDRKTLLWTEKLSWAILRLCQYEIFTFSWLSLL